jgi:hypothetical protein
MRGGVSREPSIGFGNWEVGRSDAMAAERYASNRSALVLTLLLLTACPASPVSAKVDLETARTALAAASPVPPQPILPLTGPSEALT